MVWRRIEEELGRDLHRMFLIERPVVAFSMERHGAPGAAAVSGAVPQLRAAHLRRLDHGAGALPSAAGTEGKSGSELDDLSFSRRFQSLKRSEVPLYSEGAKNSGHRLKSAFQNSLRFSSAFDRAGVERLET
jgi:hypothetical protein